MINASQSDRNKFIQANEEYARKLIAKEENVVA